MRNVQKKVVRMLALGGPSDDQITRLTRGEQYVCCQGSETEHQLLRDFCEELQQLLRSAGQELDDFTIEELSAFLEGWSDRESAR